MVSIMLFAAVPIAMDPPNAADEQARRAQALLDELKESMGLPYDIRIAIVVNHPLVFSVEPVNQSRSHYVLSMELAFLQSLDDEELRAALAHELGHVWIFTHHPYLQTERLANIIGQRAVERSNFKRVYTKLWAYEHSSGVPMDQLLGPAPAEAPTGEPGVVAAAPEMTGPMKTTTGMSTGPVETEGAGVTVWAKGHEGEAIAGLDGSLYDPYRREVIGFVQEELKTRGLYPGPVNMVLDAPTMNAIFAFQKATGALTPCGVPTPRTRALLEQGSHTDPNVRNR